jgi:hypothetical protein
MTARPAVVVHAASPAAPPPPPAPKAAMAVARPVAAAAPVAEAVAAAPAERAAGKSKGLIFAIVGVVALVIVGLGVMLVLKKKGAAAGAGGDGKGGKTADGKPAVNGLELVHFELQKAKDGGLIYVIGSVTNHADKQFFNLKVEFNVLDQAGTTLGNASDYVGNIGPHAAWPFKALVLEEGAKQVKLADFHFEKE